MAGISEKPTTFYEFCIGIYKHNIAVKSMSFIKTLWTIHAIAIKDIAPRHTLYE